MNIKKIAWLLAIPLILGGCSLVKETLPQYSMKHNGRDFEMAEGTKFQVVLDSNQTTGYKWEIEDITDGVLEMIDNKYRIANSSGDAVGTGGQEVWTFQVLKVDRSRILMKYRRPWETTTEAAKSFSISINGNPADGLVAYLGTIHSTAEGAQYDDFFRSQDGDEFGIDPYRVNKIADPGVRTRIEEATDTDSIVEIRGQLVEDADDYGDKQIIVYEIETVGSEE